MGRSRRKGDCKSWQGKRGGVPLDSAKLLEPTSWFCVKRGEAGGREQRSVCNIQEVAGHSGHKRQSQVYFRTAEERDRECLMYVLSGSLQVLAVRQILKRVVTGRVVCILECRG